MLLVHSLSNIFNDTLPWLSRAMRMVAILPISCRKPVVNAMQLGRFTDDVANAINSSVIFTTVQLSGVVEPLSGEEAHRILEPVLWNKAARSLLWMFARTLPEPSMLLEGQEIRNQGFLKEFGASQVVFSDEQVRDYLPLLGLPSLRALPEVYERRTQRVVPTFANKLNRLGPLYPSVQRKKNVSRETAYMYQQLRPDTDVTSVTTRDLEVLRAQTGYQLGGGCEMRSAWKFNDLKPRLYYSMGGEGYFVSRYFKNIAQCLMEAIPTSEVKRRTNPEDYLGQDPDNDYVITWDYESFTTRLSELKYFLYYISEGLRDQAVNDLVLFDYALGEVVVHPSELLDEYNSAINVQSPFSINRVLGEEFYIFEADRTYHQQNSGMLGVPGNIGLSTALHALLTMEIFGPDKGVCVGDDAKGITNIDPFKFAVHDISQLGSIHPSKFTISYPGDTEPYRFLKRAFYREPDGSFYRDPLMVFPLAPLIDGCMHHRDYFGDKSELALTEKLCTQVGSLVWSFLGQLEYTKEEMAIAYQFLKVTYNKMKFPMRGFLPGFKSPWLCSGAVMKVALPSILFEDYDPRVIDWVDHLLLHRTQETYNVPIMVFRSPFQLPSQGDEILSYDHPLWAAMEDLGHVKSRPVFEMKIVLNEEDKRTMKKAIGKCPRGYAKGRLVTILEEIPEHFHSFFIGHGFNVYRSTMADYM